VCDLENLVNEEAMTCVGSKRHRKQGTILDSGNSAVTHIYRDFPTRLANL